MKRSHRGYDLLKRLLDVVAAATLLVVLSPVLIVIASIVRISLGPPVFFRQQRPGKNGAPFMLVKFRTMAETNAEGAQATTTDADRLTSVGRALRATSLDELPELWNVLLGQMSIVGPRPLLMEYLDRYTPEQTRRHEVRPGITGWAQVNGRNAISWEERFRMDVWYVDNRSLLLDLKILWLTVATVFKREGISAQGHATMEPFDPRRPDPPSKEDA